MVQLGEKKAFCASNGTRVLSIPSTHIKKLGVTSPTCNPSAGENAWGLIS